MKALTNILSHLLMLLMLFIVACTEETAEVDNLMRQEQYVTVRMNIPGMTATATRAADGVIESITALAFDDADKLLEIETITTVTNTNTNNGFNGTFNLTVPNGTTTIHFLANLPYDATSQLPTEKGGSEVDVMTSLTTDDFNNLCYWGMTTTWDGNTNPLNVTLYRNLAKISIKPSITDTEFNQFEEEDLIIAGLINPNRLGKLVPYNNSFPQSIGELIYNTLPDNPNQLNRTPIGNDGAGYGNWLYVLEHENSNYEEFGLFVICKIGDYFYNVALTSDGVNPYPIIRNHEYIIYVSDVDDYQSEEYRSTKYDDMYDTNTSKILKTPINLEVKQKENASLTLTSATNTLYYGASSEEAVTVTVSGIVEGVESLTLTAPGFSVLTDYATLQDGKYILDDGVTEIDFTLTLTNPAQAGTISVTGEGEYVNITNPNPITITPTLREEVDGETVLWQGAVKMHTPDDGANHAGKVLIPYSFFFDESNQPKVPVGSVVRIESTGSDWLSADETNGEWSSIWSLNNNGQDLVLTQDMLNTIRNNHNEVWGVDVAFVLQGGDGRVLNKVTLIPAKERIEANITNGETLYYDSDDAQVVTVNVTIPDGVKTLNISAPDFIFGEEESGSYTYAVNSQTSATLSFTLKSGLSAKTSTITFSDASGNATQASVNVNLIATPSLQFEYDNSKPLYLDSNPQLPVTITVPIGSSLTQLNISATDFTVTASSGTLSGSEGSYTYTGGSSRSTTFTFVPTTIDATTITFTGTGTNLKDVNTTITVDVEDTKPEVTEKVIWEYENDIIVSSWNTFDSGLTKTQIEKLKEGCILTIELDYREDAGDNVLRILSMGGGQYNNADIDSFKKNYYETNNAINTKDDMVLACALTELDIEMITQGGLHFWGNAYTVTRIYLVEKTNN